MSRARREAAALWAVPAGRAALLAAGALVVATLVALAVLWPGGEAELPPIAGAGEARAAEVVAVDAEGCRPDLGPGCRLLGIRFDDGTRSTASFAGDARSPLVEVGADIRVVRGVPGAGAPPWVFLDLERRGTLLWLALAFVAVIGVLARRRGLLALLGLGAALALLASFVVPAILDGTAPVLVAVVGALAIMLATLLLAHGLSAITLGLTAALAAVAVPAAQLTGLDGEASLVLAGAGGDGLEPRGLLLAGMIIGALGVLDDVTVSQASTVAALRRAAPDLPAARLYREAIAVGRDHLAATVNTLALAYAGAALPVLLLFSTVGTSLGDALNREVVAAEVVALLVGSIGLACAVPLTTAVAVGLVRHLPAPLLDDHHGHAH